MTEKDPNYLPKLERAISKKYGSETIDNPRQFWDETKEQEYLKQSREARLKMQKLQEHTEKVEQDGFLINKKLLNRGHNRTCTVCDSYSFDVRDSLYLNKYECCRRCHIKWVESREERWSAGWRPPKETNNGDDT